MKFMIIWLIRSYQKHLPDKFKRHCLFQETCSQFSIREIEQNGIIKGCLATVARISKCRPGYTILARDTRLGVRLKNGEYLDGKHVSPALLMPYKKSIDTCERKINGNQIWK